MKIKIISFGYKYHSAPDSDLVIDCRILNNPYWDDNLRSYSGKDKSVREYIFSDDLSLSFLENLKHLIFDYLELAEMKKSDSVSFAFGCTGGHHRSVAVAETIYDCLTSEGYDVDCENIDLERE